MKRTHPTRRRLTASGAVPLPDGAAVKVALLDAVDDPVSESSTVTVGGAASTVTFPAPVDVEAVAAARVPLEAPGP